MNLLSIGERTIDRLTPAALSENLDSRKRVRMFLLSHLFGPCLGLPIPAALYCIDPAPLPHVAILAASIAAFWLFLIALQLLPRSYPALAFLSITNLNFAVLWAAYSYGGVTSPFLMWYMLLPMLGLFYLGGSAAAKVGVCLQVLVGLCTFSIALLLRPDAPAHLSASAMLSVATISVFCATAYAFFMASYYTQVVDSQSELIREVARHEQTLSMLTVAKDETERSKSLVESRNVELETAKSRLEYSALHDALTGLPNRRYLDEMLLTYAAERPRGFDTIALLNVDLDQFKQINDTLGHVAGDAMLVHTASVLKDSVRPDDFVARIGGDEFIVLCRSQVTSEDLTAMAERIIDQLRQPVPYQTHLCRFGACVGVAIESGNEADADRLLVNSDIALYRAKARGRNRCEFFSPELQSAIVQRKSLADDILRGLEHNEFLAHYQLQFDARTFDVVGAEALVRWRHPDGHLRSPGAFLDVADDLNVLNVIDRVIFNQAQADLDRWSVLGIPVGRASVNVSSRRLAERELIEDLRRLKIQPGSLSFELVESIFLDEVEQGVAANIAQIRALGIDIEIDDFGTGHASIVSLLKINPTRLKIDRQFVTHIATSSEHRRLIASIIEIGRSLGIKVVAEGVESLDQAYLLRDLGCDILQGFYFARPMSASDVEAFMLARERVRA